MLWKNFWSGSLAYKTTLEKQYFIDSEPKVAIDTSKFKLARQAQFLSHTLQILEINLSFEACKMIFLYLIKISFSFWYTKNGKENAMA